MKMAKYKHLLHLLFGQTVFRNRIFNSPTGVSVSLESFIGYYERKAMGGGCRLPSATPVLLRRHGPSGPDQAVG